VVRKQLYIDDELDRRLKAIAARTGRSEADHVRAALRSYLAVAPAPTGADGDPLLDLIGLAGDADTPNDVAVNHDHYLYGAPKIA
jgi:hypothetical protein